MLAAAHTAVWLGWAFCTLVAMLWAWSGKLGFALLWVALACAYLWQAPSPRPLALSLLRAITGR